VKLADIIHGRDPLAAKKAVSRLKCMGDLCQSYMDKHSKIHKKSWKEDERRINVYILPKLKTLAAVAITVNDLAELHLKIGENSIYEANRTIELLRAVFEKGRIWGFIPLDAVNPAKGIVRFKEKKRDRWLTPDELPRVARAIAEEENIYVRAAIWLYLLTGVRKTELLTAKWEDIDFTRGELRLKDTKAGNDHYVPLSTAAVQILSTLPRIHSNPYLIPGGKEGAHLVNISKPWNRIRKKAAVLDVRLHDLRRTVGSWLAQNGMSLHLIGRVLNHQSSDTTKIYARFGQDTLRNALEDHGLKLISTSSSPVEGCPE
jgi:integrase